MSCYGTIFISLNWKGKLYPKSWLICGECFVFVIFSCLLLGSTIRFPGPSGSSRKSHHLGQFETPNQFHLVGFRPVTFPFVLVAPAPHLLPGYYHHQQPIINVPMKQEKYKVSPNAYTFPKEEGNSYYNPPSIDINETLFYPDKVLASYVRILKFLALHLTIKL